MSDRLDADLVALGERGFALQRHPQPDGWTFLVFETYALPSGYSQVESDMLIKIPPPFPLAGLDMFWLRPDLRLATGELPASTCVELLLERPWLRFSWHPATWRPGRDSISTYLNFVDRRLQQGK